MLETVWRKGNALALLVGMYIDIATMEDGMETPLKKKKLGIKPPNDPAIPLLGIYPEKPKLKNSHVSHCSLQHYLQ